MTFPFSESFDHLRPTIFVETMPRPQRSGLLRKAKESAVLALGHFNDATNAGEEEAIVLLSLFRESLSDADSFLSQLVTSLAESRHSYPTQKAFQRALDIAMGEANDIQCMLLSVLEEELTKDEIVAVLHKAITKLRGITFSPL
jgi:hypothetical protein